jgi:hypothetical protein
MSSGEGAKVRSFRRRRTCAVVGVPSRVGSVALYGPGHLFLLLLLTNCFFRQQEDLVHGQTRRKNKVLMVHFV